MDHTMYSRIVVTCSRVFFSFIVESTYIRVHDISIQSSSNEISRKEGCWMRGAVSSANIPVPSAPSAGLKGHEGEAERAPTSTWNTNTTPLLGTWRTKKPQPSPLNFYFSPWTSFSPTNPIPVHFPLHRERLFTASNLPLSAVCESYSFAGPLNLTERVDRFDISWLALRSRRFSTFDCIWAWNFLSWVSICQAWPLSQLADSPSKAKSNYSVTPVILCQWLISFFPLLGLFSSDCLVGWRNSISQVRTHSTCSIYSPVYSPI